MSAELGSDSAKRNTGNDLGIDGVAIAVKHSAIFFWFVVAGSMDGEIFRPTLHRDGQILPNQILHHIFFSRTYCDFEENRLLDRQVYG
jgi:hypothetical protein